MKLMIIGASGLVGRSCKKAAQSRGYQVIPYSFQSTQKYQSMDIRNHDQVQKEIETQRPAVVILAANSPGGVNHCEAHQQEALKFHFEATINIAKTCKEKNIKFVYFSSDYVFRDTSETITEESIPNPINWYGVIKAKSETWILNHLIDPLIIRTTNVYGWDPLSKTPNFFSTLFQKFQIGLPFGVPSYLFGNPTYAPDLAEAVLNLIDAQKHGIYHIVGPDFISRYQWGERTKDFFSFKLVQIIPENPPEVESVPRPRKICLGTHKYHSEFPNHIFRTLEQAYQDIQNQMSHFQDKDVSVMTSSFLPTQSPPGL